MNSAHVDSPIPARLEINQYGWLHIRMEELLPSNRASGPMPHLQALELLLRGYVARGGRLPYFERALLVILERCNLGSRKAFDQDNKAWKGIPNLLKGLVVEDDDQFHLEVALLTERSEEACCHIYVLPAEEAETFFALRGGLYGDFL